MRTKSISQSTDFVFRSRGTILFRPYEALQSSTLCDLIKKKGIKLCSLVTD